MDANPPSNQVRWVGFLEIDVWREEALLDEFFPPLDLLVYFQTSFFGNSHGLPMAHSALATSRILSTASCCHRHVAIRDRLATVGIWVDVLGLELAVNISFQFTVGKVALLAKRALVRYCRQVQLLLIVVRA